MERAKILVVEDEVGIRELIHLYLEKKNYHVIQAENGAQALELLNVENPQLVLLDIEMPGINGFEVCQSIRKVLNVPIIFISNRRDVKDKVKCFELGGDDYITKPFDFSELEARIMRNLRRYEEMQNPQSTKLSCGRLEINFDSFECFVNGSPITLSKKEMQLLILLAKRPNRVFSAEQIYDLIWGMDSYGDIQTVKVHIRNLRSKIEADPAHPKYIITVRGFGYRFVC